MELLNLFGLIMSFTGSLLLLLDPTLMLTKNHSKTFIEDRSSIFEIPEYTDEMRTKMIRQIRLRRAGLGLLCIGFFLQLVPVSLSYLST
ncbi:hypothetical protein FF32_15580 [Halomonas campaniensis]|nr:hypothetical protein FF32_15580 [Halomonas campaniensis]